MARKKTTVAEITLSTDDAMVLAIDKIAFTKALNKLAPRFRLAFVTDLHLPDYNLHAWDVALKIIQDAKPDIVPHGSDVFDFMNVSVKWEVSDQKRAEDAWDGTSAQYSQLMRELDSACPDGCLHPFLVGNHDIRMYKWIVKYAPQFSNMMSKIFVSLIRDNGGMWLGIDAIELEIGNDLLLAHGHQFGSGGARSNGDKAGWSHHILSAHIHQFTAYNKQTRRGTVQSMTSGCMCNLEPMYLKHQGRGAIQNWHHGIVLVDFDVLRNIIIFQPVNIYVKQGTYIAHWADAEYTAMMLR